MSTETIDSRSLLKNVTVPDPLTSVPIHNQQRVAILREDIKDLNDKVNILTGQTVEVISLKEIADRLTVSSEGKSNLNLQDKTINEVFEVTPKTTSTTYKYDKFDSGYVGLKSITQTIEVQLTGLQESTNIIIDKNFLETDGNIDLTSSETYFGTKEANITAIIDDTIEVDLDHNTLGDSTFITVQSSQENAIGMKEVKVTPKLSELTIQSAMLSTDNAIEITPQTIAADSQSIGFNKVKLPIKETKECLVQLAVSTFSTVSDDIIFVKNEDAEASVYSSEIIKPMVTSNVLDSVILINNSPKSFDYVLSKDDIDLLTQAPDSGRAETLTIKSIDTQNCLQSITIPRFEKQTLEINSSEIKDALVKAADGNNLQQITKITPDGILYDQVIIQMPVLENPTFSKGLGSLFFIKTEEQNLALSIDDTDINSSSTNIPLIQSFDIASYNMGDVENAQTQIEANTTTIITDNFKTYSSNDDKFLATQTKQNERILLVDNSHEQTLELKLKSAESFSIKIEQQQANSDQKKELFTINYPGRQIKITNTGLEEVEAPIETITFANTFFKKFDYNLTTEDSTSSNFSGYRYPKFSFSADEALTELNYPDDLNSQVDFDSLENNIEILSQKGITLATLDSDANYAPTFFVSATCERQNEVKFDYSIKEDESLISTDSKVSQIISELLSDDTYNCKILKTITYDGLTYNLTKTSTNNIDFIGTYTAVVSGLENGYVYDFIVTEDTISFYALSRYEEVENTEDTTN